MVRDLERVQQSNKFPESAPAGEAVFYRTYSRRQTAGRESWQQVGDRILDGLVSLGKLTPEQAALIAKMQQQLKSLSSGRWLWVGGTQWLEKSENFSGAYNCTSTNVVDWRAFGLMMDLAMMGCGTGAVLEPKYINQLPAIRNRLNVELIGKIGTTPAEMRREKTEVKIDGNNVTIYVGDSRDGWVKSYQTLLELSSDERFTGDVIVQVVLNDIRGEGERLQGFGGVANPVKLPELYDRCASILNKAIGRQLNSVECCLLIDEAAVVVVAGNVRRSAGMRQGASDDELFANAKGNLWHQDEHGNWRIDPERDALRMANHTRVFHRKPSIEECINAVRQQYYSGEGAIQWAGEAIARANADIVNTPELKKDFLKTYTNSETAAATWLQNRAPQMPATEVEHRLSRYALNPCGEILGANFHCVSGETQLITRDSLHKIKDVVGEQIEIWNGKRWSKIIPFQTNTEQKLYRVSFADGSYLDATEYHRFFVVFCKEYLMLMVASKVLKDRFGKEYKEVQTKDLLNCSKYSIHTEPFTIDYLDGIAVDSAYAYTLGVAVGDGTIDSNGNAKIRLYQQKSKLVVAGNKSPERNYSYLPPFVDVTDLGFSGELLQRLKHDADSLNAIASWHKQAILAFIAGLADTDGSNTDSYGIRIYISDYERAYRLQLLTV